MSICERTRDLIEAIRSFDHIVADGKKKLDLDVASPEAVVINLLSRWKPIREMLDGLKKVGE